MPSQEENVNENFKILATVVNRFKLQIIRTERKTMDSICTFNLIRIFVYNDILNFNLNK